MTGLSIHAGLWTSAALNAPPRSVPVLRQRLAAFEARFGFDPAGHTGKALAHAMGALPHDLTTAFDADAVERLALTALDMDGSTVVTGNNESAEDALAWATTTMGHFGASGTSAAANLMRPTPDTARLAYLMLARLGG